MSCTSHENIKVRSGFCSILVTSTNQLQHGFLRAGTQLWSHRLQHTVYLVSVSGKQLELRLYEINSRTIHLLLQ